MESFNFGAFDTNLGARIAAIPQEAQKQQSANMLQAMQMQGAMRQNEMSQMQLDEMKTDRAEMVKLQQDLAAKGGSPDLNQYADMLLKSPKHMKLGLELKQKLNDQARYAAIMGRTQPAAAPPMAPAVAPEPGSFSAAVAARREADPFARSPERANMLPGVVAAPAGVNAMVGGGGGNAAQIAFKQQQRDALIGLGTTQSIAAARAIDADIALLARQPQRNTVASPGQIIYGPNGEIIATAPDKVATPPSMVAEYTFAKTPDGGNFRGSFQDFVTTRAAAARAPAQPRPEAAPRTQQVTMRDGTLGIMNMDTGAITPSNLGGVPVKGKPSAFAEKTAIQRKQMGNDLGFAISQLADITKDGGLIDQSTGSGAGRLTDISAGFFGKATPGAIAIGKIAPIADLALKMVPRFEGPQSNADTKSYKEAAGQLADSSLPTAIRKEAGKVVLRIMQARKNQFVTSDMAAEGATGGDEAAPAVNVDALLKKYE